MKLDVNRFESFPARVVLEGRLDPLKPDSDSLIGIGQVRIDLRVQKSNDEFYCQGEMTAKATLECARCLGEFERELSGKVDFIVSDKEKQSQWATEAIDDEDYLFLDSSGLSVDLTPIIRQAIVLSLSMKPICSENCRGFCSVCRVNLNKSSCNCQQKSTDPRWDALKDLANGQP